MEFSKLVALALALEAFLFFYLAYLMALVFRVAHGSLAQVLSAGSANFFDGILLVVGAMLYFHMKQMRPWLRILMMAAAIYGSLSVWSTRYFVHSYSGIFQKDIIATGAITSAGLVVVGFLGVADYLADKFNSTR